MVSNTNRTVNRLWLDIVSCRRNSHYSYSYNVDIKLLENFAENPKFQKIKKQSLFSYLWSTSRRIDPGRIYTKWIPTGIHITQNLWINQTMVSIEYWCSMHPMRESIEINYNNLFILLTFKNFTSMMELVFLIIQ